MGYERGAIALACFGARMHAELTQNTRGQGLLLMSPRHVAMRVALAPCQEVVLLGCGTGQPRARSAHNETYAYSIFLLQIKPLSVVLSAAKIELLRPFF